MMNGGMLGGGVTSVGGGSTLYTVEQLELIRRLRNSGITKEDVIGAFDSFERLDKELGQVYNIPVTFALQAQTLQLLAMGLAGSSVNQAGCVAPPPIVTTPLFSAPCITTPSTPLSVISPRPLNNLTGISLQQNLPVIHLGKPTFPGPSIIIQPADCSSIPFVDQSGGIQPTFNPSPRLPMPVRHNDGTRDVNGTGILSVNGLGMDGSTTGSCDSGSSSSSLQQRNALLQQLASGLMKGGGVCETDVDPEEFAEFISQGEDQCCEEIKNFSLQHNVKQQQVAVLSGVCQSYVSRYMKGDIYDMSERSRRAIQRWYIVYRKDPSIITMAANAATMFASSATSTPTGGSQPDQAHYTSAGQQQLQQLQARRPSGAAAIDIAELAAAADAGGGRRERFVFRPNHLEILERYFHDNNYPSYETREEIALACNIVSQSLSGRELVDREKVSLQVISNWFANKRKELKKLAKEEGLIDVSSVPMRPRGQPSRLYSDIAIIQHNRCGTTGVTSTSSLTSFTDHLVSSSGANHSPAGEESSRDGDQSGDDLTDAGAATQGASQVSSDSSEHPSSTVPYSEQGGYEDEGRLHMSVEMAAVNQAILSLTGQQPIDITAVIRAVREKYGVGGESTADTAAAAADGAVSAASTATVAAANTDIDTPAAAAAITATDDVYINAVAAATAITAADDVNIETAAVTAAEAPMDVAEAATHSVLLSYSNTQAV